jgi:hypothetical protein
MTLLVYEYVENKNLAEALWGMVKFTSMPKIIIKNSSYDILQIIYNMGPCDH